MTDCSEAILAPLFLKGAVVIDEDVDACCKRIAEKAKIRGKNVTIMTLPEATAGALVERVRVALTTVDVATNKKVDILLVTNVYEAALANKSLPANLGALKSGSGVRVAYMLDARDPDVRAALSRRDFLKALGPIFVPPYANFQEKNEKKQLKEFLAKVDIKDSPSSLINDDEYNVLVGYDRMRDNKKASREHIQNVVDMFVLASRLEVLALNRDADALQAIATGIQEYSIESLPVHPVSNIVKKTTSQALTRCGMHVNIQKQLQEVAASEHMNASKVAEMASLAFASRFRL
jgi:hypothetical protein